MDLLDAYAAYLGDDARLLTPAEAEEEMQKDRGFQDYLREREEWR